MQEKSRSIIAFLNESHCFSVNGVRGSAFDSIHAFEVPLFDLGQEERKRQERERERGRERTKGKRKTKQ